MITGELKNRIDSLWTDFWTGGITNPLTVIEQITFLMYSRLLDMQERKDEQRASVTGKDVASRFGEADQNCRWETGDTTVLRNAASCARPRVPAFPSTWLSAAPAR
jgi:type I restriction enzyme M protein